MTRERETRTHRQVRVRESRSSKSISQAERERGDFVFAATFCIGWAVIVLLDVLL